MPNFQSSDTQNIVQSIRSISIETLSKLKKNKIRNDSSPNFAYFDAENILMDAIASHPVSIDNAALKAK